MGLRNVEELAEPYKFGDVPNGDYLEIETDGTTVQRGKSSVWEDLTGSLIARRLESTIGRLQYGYSENGIIMQDGGSLANTADTLIFNFQKPHGAKETGSMNLHIHWEQENANAVVFSGQYRVQNNGAAKTTAWIPFSGTMADNAFTYVSGTLNQITKLVDINLTGVGLSATIQFQLARTDSTGANLLATFIDAHVEYDMNGSRLEYVK